MLSKRMRKYVESEDKAGYSKEVQAVYNNRLYISTVRTLKDLAILAEKLPEKQQQKIFNTRTLAPFFESLFQLEIRAKDSEDYVQVKENKEMKEKRQRLLALSATALGIIGEWKFARALLPEPLKPYLTASFPPIENFKAILCGLFMGRNNPSPFT